MSYVVESKASARAKSRRTAIVLGVLVLLLAAAFYYASSYWNAAPSPSAAGATCTPSASGSPAPGQVTVNVFNATKRNGLAGSTATSVKERGFVVGTVANDPAGKSVPHPALVRFGPNGEAGARLVVALVSGAVQVKDTRADASVDLVLGDGFTAVASPTAPVPAPAGSPC